MVDPEDVERAHRRDRRLFEIFEELGRPGADTRALLAEHMRLSEEANNYVGGLLAEIDADHTLRSAAVDIQREDIADKVAIAAALLPDDLPDSDPKHRIIQLISKYASGQDLTADEQAWLQAQLPNGDQQP